MASDKGKASEVYGQVFSRLRLFGGLGGPLVADKRELASFTIAAAFPLSTAQPSGAKKCRALSTLERQGIYKERLELQCLGGHFQ